VRAKRTGAQFEPDALGLLESAVGVLRHAPPGVLLGYYAGALPFAVALLYFLADMSRSAFAADRVAEASLALGVLFVWMKCWHAVFCRNLLALASGEPLPRWTPKRLMRVALTQAALQPWALWVRPVAVLITVPYAWVFAFFQHVLVVAESETGSIRTVFSQAAAQARLFPKQNHLALTILTAFGLFVWINVSAAIFLGPMLAKMLLGMETQFTRSPIAMLNTTFLAASIVTAYLCSNPLTQAFYVLCAFHGQSRRTGADLQVELRRITDATQPALS